MFIGQSILSAVAAGIYAFVLATCLAACVSAGIRRQPVSHVMMWASFALVFGVLILIRAAGLEELWRDALRTQLLKIGAYDERRAYQRPMVAAMIVIVSPIAFWLFYRIVQARGRRRQTALNIAGLGAIVMAGLMALRIISLHQVDALIYGPLKINWLGDLVGSLMVLLSAITYIRLLGRSR